MRQRPAQRRRPGSRLRRRFSAPPLGVGHLLVGEPVLHRTRELLGQRRAHALEVLRREDRVDDRPAVVVERAGDSPMPTAYDSPSFSRTRSAKARLRAFAQDLVGDRASPGSRGSCRSPAARGCRSASRWPCPASRCAIPSASSSGTDPARARTATAIFQSPKSSVTSVAVAAGVEVADDGELGVARRRTKRPWKARTASSVAASRRRRSPRRSVGA